MTHLHNVKRNIDASRHIFRYIGVHLQPLIPLQALEV